MQFSFEYLSRNRSVFTIFREGGGLDYEFFTNIVGLLNICNNIRIIIAVFYILEATDAPFSEKLSFIYMSYISLNFLIVFIRDGS